MPFTKAGRYHELLFVNYRISPNTDVTVYLAGTTTPATLYTNRDKTASLATSVVRSDVAGNLAFWADPGLYDLVTGGVTTSSVEVSIDSTDTPASADVVQLTGAQTIAGVKSFTSGLRSSGNTQTFGTGALGAAGAYIQIGDLGDAGNVYFITQGSGANVGAIFRTRGTGVFAVQPGGGGLNRLVADGTGDAVAAGGDTSIALVQNATGKRIGVGAIDSGGAGFRLLRVPN